MAAPSITHVCDITKVHAGTCCPAAIEQVVGLGTTSAVYFSVASRMVITQILPLVFDCVGIGCAAKPTSL
jgi:hypothetical protein